MSSYKDIFEPDIFAANMFACGTWRGKGVDVAATVNHYHKICGPIRYHKLCGQT